MNNRQNGKQYFFQNNSIFERDYFLLKEQKIKVSLNV